MVRGTKIIIFEKYSSKNLLMQRRWYWRIRHLNGNVMADCSEAYNSKKARDDALNTIITQLTNNGFAVRDKDLGDKIGRTR